MCVDTTESEKFQNDENQSKNENKNKRRQSEKNEGRQNLKIAQEES